ncbi:MAG: DUF4835 family protein [Bacteroidetes bacterium]|nr:DUF4835 family protein [Bacteroidota bacterium]
MRRFCVFILLMAAIALAPRAGAQQLNCTVRVDYSALTGNEFQFLGELQEEIRRYLNDRSWADDVFQDRERIDCSFQIVFTLADGLSRFEAQIVVGASRPIYGTQQRTTVFLVQDDNWTFEYGQGRNLVYNPNSFDSFISVIDFYAFLILGYDYDTFDELGGQEFFEEAREIFELGRGVNAEGWFIVGDERTRGSLITQLLDPRFDPLRRAHFQYHYGVLDHFATDHEQAWDDAMVVIRNLNELYNEFNTRRFATDIFFSAKHQEIADLFADFPERADAYELLIEMDTQHQTTYDEMVQ